MTDFIEKNTFLEEPINLAIHHGKVILASGRSFFLNPNEIVAKKLAMVRDPFSCCEFLSDAHKFRLMKQVEWYRRHDLDIIANLEEFGPRDTLS